MKVDPNRKAIEKAYLKGYNKGASTAIRGCTKDYGITAKFVLQDKFSFTQEEIDKFEHHFNMMYTLIEEGYTTFEDIEEQSQIEFRSYTCSNIHKDNLECKFPAHLIAGSEKTTEIIWNKINKISEKAFRDIAELVGMRVLNLSSTDFIEFVSNNIVAEVEDRMCIQVPRKEKHYD